MQNHSFLTVLADARRARLVGLKTNNKRTEAIELCALEFADEGHEHHRPTMLDSRGGHHEPAVGHEAEEFRARFAKQIDQWLRHQPDVQQCETLVVAAPAKMLGALRHSLRGPRLIEFVEGEFTHLSAADIATHPRFQELAAKLRPGVPSVAAARRGG